MVANPSNRDDAISGFVRMKIREWRDSGRELQDLARAGGIGKSTPSQVIRGTGVGAKTGPGFARAFGYKDFDDLKSAAYAWWQQDGAAHAAAIDEPHTEAMGAAIEMVLGMNQGTREQLETVLAAYAHPRFHDRDAAWWVQTLLAELERDRVALRADKAERLEAAAGQRVVQEAQRQKKAARASAPGIGARKRAG